MSVTIVAADNASQLRVSGDIEQTFVLPLAESDGSQLAISLSDGTLLKADVAAGRPGAFRVEVEGAGIVRPVGDGVVVEWAVEWVTVTAANMAARPRRVPSRLPLFPHYAAA